MDAYYAVVKPKLNNLLGYLSVRIKEEMIKENGQIDEEVLGAIISGYEKVYNDPIALGTAIIDLLKFWGGPEKGVDREGLKAEVVKRKAEAHAIFSKMPGFKEDKWQMCVNYNLPEDVEDKLYQYYHMLCDLAVAFGIDKL